MVDKAKKKAAKKNPEKEKKQPENKQKNKVTKKQVFLGIAAFFVLVTWWALQPLTAGDEFGVCRTYVENNLKYPTTFKITKYDEFGPSTRLFYTHTDAYGNQRSEMIECLVKPDPQTGGFVLHDIKVNRRSIGTEKLRLFNSTLPGILKSEPSRIIPKPSKGGLVGLKRD